MNLIIPDPSRLWPPAGRPSGASPGLSELWEATIALGAYASIPLLTMIAYMVSPWLALLAFCLGGPIIISLDQNAPVVLGVIETPVLAFLALLLTGGAEAPNPFSLIAAGIVGIIFLWATYAAWQDRK